MDTRLNGRIHASAGRRAIDHPLGACMLIRRAAWDDVGPLDEGYFMYLEEIDWCRRARARGWQIWYQPARRAIHHGGASTRQQPDAMFAQLWRSRLRYYQRFHGPAYNRLVHALVRLGLRAGARRADRAVASVSRLPPSDPRRPTLTAAVIARDEERMLGDCLRIAGLRRRAPGAGRRAPRAIAPARSRACRGARVEERAFDNFAGQRDAALGLATRRLGAVRRCRRARDRRACGTKCWPRSPQPAAAAASGSRATTT